MNVLPFRASIKLGEWEVWPFMGGRGWGGGQGKGKACPPAVCRSATAENTNNKYILIDSKSSQHETKGKQAIKQKQVVKVLQD